MELCTFQEDICMELYFITHDKIKDKRLTPLVAKQKCMMYVSFLIQLLSNDLDKLIKWVLSVGNDSTGLILRHCDFKQYSTFLIIRTGWNRFFAGLFGHAIKTDNWGRQSYQSFLLRNSLLPSKIMVRVLEWNTIEKLWEVDKRMPQLRIIVEVYLW